MATVSGKTFDIHLLKRIMSYTRPVRGSFYFATVITFVMSFLAPLRPMLIGRMVNEHIETGDKERLLYWALVITGILFAEAILQYYQTYLANWLGQNIIKRIRDQLFTKILNFRLRYFDNTAIGRLVTRAVSDIETIAQIFSQGILIIIGDLLKLVMVVLFMLYMDWQITLLVLLPIPLLIYSTKIFKNAIQKAFQEVRNQVSRLNTFVQEHLTGINIVQVFNRQKREYEKFKEINAKHRDAHFRSVWAYSIFFPVVEMLSALSLAIMIFWGVMRVRGGAENIETLFGDLFAFILYIHMLYRPIRQLADRFNVLQMGMVGSERVFNILDTEDRIPDDGSVKALDLKGDIAFKKVWFAYEDDAYVLKDVSFQVSAGKSVALVGATGAGKSSVINLLTRLYDFQGGGIDIDGRDIREYDLASLRENLGVVMQDVFLFSDTIFNNITLYRSDITRQEVEDAARAVGAHEFIQRLPDGYDQNVRERGSSLSVGQRQLIAFIRAYVFDPRILILDEATSSVDSETELLIQHAIEKLTRDRTSIVIAHRLSTIQQADKILVMDQGEVVESGTHADLIEQDGHYQQLYELQFKH